MGFNITLLTIVLWIPQALYQVLTWIYWWQDKEYRFDRFKVLLLSKDSTRRLWANIILIKIFAILIAIYTKSLWPITLVIIGSNIIFLLRFFSEGLRRPVFTQRARRILYTSLIFITLTFILFLTSVSGYFQGWILFLGEISLIISAYLGILWTAPIVNRIKNEEVKRAKEKLSEVKPIVLGITGSYGKTTTKEFVAHILSQKYKVAATTGSENTEFGIARKTTEFVKKDTEYFVVEMGAYKRGEISALSRIVSPVAAILTGIEPQHLSLFGSLENIKLAKFELIESLPLGGIAFFNSTNKYARELAGKARSLKTNLEVYEYGFDLKARVLTQNVESSRVEFLENGEKVVISVGLPGVHLVENLGVSVLVARKFGLSWEEIKKGIASLSLPDKTMRVREFDSGAVIIDDSYNSTPKGFEAALDYLALYKKKKKAVIT